MDKPVTCIYDNDATWRREIWRNGEVVAWFSAELVLSVTKEDRRRISFYDSVMMAGKWKPGNIVGDPAAIGPKS